MDKQRDFVLRTIEERGVKFVRLWFTDVIGTLKSVAIAPAEVEGAFAEGIGFDGSAIEGLTRSYESDLLAQPDPTTFQTLPWRGEIDPTARMFCDITTPDGQPAPVTGADLGLNIQHRKNAVTRAEVEYRISGYQPADPATER